MLKSLDVLIGVSTVMLLASMIVMAITHFLMMLVNARGKHLRTGLSELLRQLDPKLEQDVARRIIDKVLCFPLLKTATGRLGSVVHREEFVKLLLELAGQSDGSSGLDKSGQVISLADPDQKALRVLLANNGIPKPEETLARIRELALQIERNNPELAADVRQRIAIIQEAESKFVSGVHTWFDRTIDRVSERFTAYMRAVTYGVAVLVVLVLQLDAIALVNRLNLDDAARKAIVEQVAPAALQMQKDSTALSSSNDDKTKADAVVVKEQVAQLRDRINKANAALATNELVPFPDSLDHWRLRWNQTFSFSKLLGMFVAAVLLSLGAPFWYKALATLLQLRSLAAQKDDAQRAARSTTPETAAQASDAAQTGSSQMPEWLRGEQGDPALVG